MPHGHALLRWSVAVCCAAWLTFCTTTTERPRVHVSAANPTVRRALAACPSLAEFAPATTCATGQHLLYVAKNALVARPPPARQEETLRMADGGDVGLCWIGPPSAVVVVWVPGILGTSADEESDLWRNVVLCRGWRCVVVRNRGVGVPLRTPRFSPLGSARDLAEVVRHVVGLGGRRVFLMGTSAGGSAAMRYLASPGAHRLVRAAFLISPSVDIEADARTCSAGYHGYILRGIKSMWLHPNEALLRSVPGWQQINAATTLTEINEIIPPFAGAKGVRQYLEETSPAGRLGHIRVPTLILHAMDDPVCLSEHVLREVRPLAETHDSVGLVLTRHGGHMVFYDAGLTSWAHRLAAEFFAGTTVPAPAR